MVDGITEQQKDILHRLIDLFIENNGNNVPRNTYWTATDDENLRRFQYESFYEFLADCLDVDQLNPDTTLQECSYNILLCHAENIAKKYEDDDTMERNPDTLRKRQLAVACQGIFLDNDSKEYYDIYIFVYSTLKKLKDDALSIDFVNDNSKDNSKNSKKNSKVSLSQEYIQEFVTYYNNKHPSFSIKTRVENGGGSIEVSMTSVRFGGSITFTVKPELHYDIQELYINDESSIEFYNNTGKSYTINNIAENIEIIARFKLKTYKIDYSLDGGSLSESQENKQYPYGKKSIDLPVPIKKGYIFVGWVMKNKQISQINLISSNLSVKAIWKKNHKIRNLSIATIAIIASVFIGITMYSVRLGEESSTETPESTTLAPPFEEYKEDSYTYRKIPGIYNGEWKNGLPDGYGVFTPSDGSSIKKGRWWHGTYMIGW
ncbi:MAG: InlB B-repeat-containing protein [Clostridiales bacterium]|nr:InlB B-repeat-containing protein [Clostridiales bacterium]